MRTICPIWIVLIALMGCSEDSTGGENSDDSGPRGLSSDQGVTTDGLIPVAMNTLAAGQSSTEQPAAAGVLSGGSGGDIQTMALSDAGTAPVPDMTQPAMAGIPNGVRQTDGGLVCEASTEEATGALRPVDIVWAIDSSPSMDDEIAIIQANLNLFTNELAQSGLDYRVILISADRDIAGNGMDFTGVCIPPPLSGAPGCPDTDSERYLHIRDPIHSRDALTVTQNAIDRWQPFLRPDARLHVIVVTDDDHRASVTKDDLIAIGFPPDFYLHSLIDTVGLAVGSGQCNVFPDQPDCSCGSRLGEKYRALSESTDGLVLNLCEADWAPIFDALRERAAAGASIPCTFDIPRPPDGLSLLFDQVNVTYVDAGGNRRQLLKTDDCVMHPQGWRYDDPLRPRRILLCPDICGGRDGRVVVEFGCRTRKN